MSVDNPKKPATTSEVCTINQKISDYFEGKLSISENILVREISTLPLQILNDDQCCAQIVSHLDELWHSRPRRLWLMTPDDYTLLFVIRLIQTAIHQNCSAQRLVEWIEKEIRAQIQWLISCSHDDGEKIEIRRHQKDVWITLLFVLAFSIQIMPLLKTYRYLEIIKILQGYQIQSFLTQVPRTTPYEPMLRLAESIVSFVQSIVATADGRYRNAISLLQQSVDFFNASEGQGLRIAPAFGATCLLTLAALHRCLGEYSHAIATAEDARVRFEGLNFKNEALRAMSSMARTYRAGRNSDMEIKTLSKAVEYAEAHCFERDAFLLYRSLGNAFLRIGQSAQAQDTFAKASKLRTSLAGKTLANLFELELRAISSDLIELTEQQTRSSHELSCQTLVMLDTERRQDFINARKLNLSASDTLWNANASESELVAAVGDCHSAANLFHLLKLDSEEARCYEQVGILLQRLHQNAEARDALILARNTWQTFRYKKRHSYQVISALEIENESAYRICCELTDLGYYNDAWQILQEGKAIYLLGINASANDSSIEHQKPIPQELQIQLDQFRSKFVQTVLGHATQQSGTAPESPNQVPDTQQVAQRAWDYLQSCSSLLGQDWLNQEALSQILPYQWAAQQIPQDGIAIDLLKADQRLQAFIIRPGSQEPEVVTWFIADELFENIALQVYSWRTFVNSDSRKIPRSGETATFMPTWRDRESAEKCLRQLWDHLIEPIIARVKGSKRLYIAPQHWLHYLPLHAAMAPDGRFLYEQFDVRYVPSVAFVSECAASSRDAHTPVDSMKANPRIVSIINPEHNGAGPVSRTLPFSEWEGCQIAELQNTSGITLSLLRGDQIVDLKSVSRWQHIDIFHYSGHADVIPGIPLLSYLRLGADILTAHDVLFRCDRFSPNSLVILNACSTQEPDIKRADNGQGLAYAFLARGASSIIATLWPIHDLAAAFVVSQFLKNSTAPNRSHQLTTAISDLRHMTWDTAITISQEVACWCQENDWQQEQAIVKQFIHELRRAQVALDACEFPFQHPAFWASFEIISRL